MRETGRGNKRAGEVHSGWGMDVLGVEFGDDGHVVPGLGWNPASNLETERARFQNGRVLTGVKQMS